MKLGKFEYSILTTAIVIFLFALIETNNLDFIYGLAFSLSTIFVGLWFINSGRKLISHSEYKGQGMFLLILGLGFSFFGIGLLSGDYLPVITYIGLQLVFSYTLVFAYMGIVLKSTPVFLILPGRTFVKETKGKWAILAGFGYILIFIYATFAMWDSFGDEFMDVMNNLSS